MAMRRLSFLCCDADGPQPRARSRRGGRDAPPRWRATILAGLAALLVLGSNAGLALARDPSSAPAPGTTTTPARSLPSDPDEGATSAGAADTGVGTFAVT